MDASERVTAVWHIALDVFKSPVDTHRFMFSNHPLLGIAPVDYVYRNDDERVQDILGRLVHGTAV